MPAPFNFGLAILLNQKMLTLAEKLQCAPALLPMLVEGQDFIDEQDELSVLDFMRKVLTLPCACMDACHVPAACCGVACFSCLVAAAALASCARLGCVRRE